MRHTISISLAVTGIVAGAAATFAAARAASSPTPTHWIAINLKGRTIALHPRSGEQIELPAAEPRGIHSPDERRILQLGTVPGSGRHTDLFVAHLDPAEPAGIANKRRITTTQDRPTSPMWLSDSRRIAFLATVDGGQQVFAADAAAGGEPVMVSDGEQPVHGPIAVTPDGRIAYRTLVRREGKARYTDLHIATLASTSRTLAVRSDEVVVEDAIMYGYAFSPDASRLAYSTHGSLSILDLETGETTTIECESIHESMWNDISSMFAWHPDGTVIAGRFGFGGGRTVVPGEEAKSKLFSDDKIIFVPVPPRSGGEGGDGATEPWWITCPADVLGMRWIAAPVE